MCFANRELFFHTKMSRMKSRQQEICSDCGSSDASWAALNRGILLCPDCCAIHRSLGRHISQIISVKSLRQGNYNPSILNFVTSLSHTANSVWEHTLSDSSSGKNVRKKPQPKDPLNPNKSEFIKAKHCNLIFVLKPNTQDENGYGNAENELSKQLHASVRTSNLETSLRLLVQGADPNYFHEEKRSKPIHVAAKFGQASQIELLIAHGSIINVVDGNGLTPVEVAKNNNHNTIAERLIEAMYEGTDRITLFLGGKKPDHVSGKHISISEQNNTEISEQLKIARGKLQLVPNKMFEELVMDLYDEVDRRENETVWLGSVPNPDVGAVPFLPANPHLSATRNQGRQKLARFSHAEFCGLLTDALVDARRRQNMANLRPIDTSVKKLQQQNQRDSNSDDEPLYDAVASDDDYAQLGPIGQACQSPNIEVEKLRKQLVHYISEINQLKNVVMILSSENSELKSKYIESPINNSSNNIYDVPLRIELNGSEPEAEPVSDSQCKRPVSMYETRLGYNNKQAECRTTTSMYQMASGEKPCSVDSLQPIAEEVRNRTDIVTKRLKEICVAMQDTKNKDQFVPCAERIRIAISELIAIFPPQNCNEIIKKAIKQLHVYTGLMQRECENLQKSISTEDIPARDAFMEEVRACALHLASATKTLVMQFP